MADEKKIEEVVDDNSQSGKEKKPADDMSAEELQSAKSLYKALKDPETAQEIIEHLAKRSGILDRKGEPTENKKETKSELGRITSKLKKSLGKDFDKFSDSVGPALDEAISELLEEKFGTSRAENTQSTWEKSVDKFTKTHETTPEIERKMSQLVKRNPPALGDKDFDADEYLNDMWELSYRKLDLELPTAKKTKSGIHNVPEIIEREIKGKVITLDDAIDAACNGIRLRRK